MSLGQRSGRAADEGFTLIEILVAVVLLGIGVTAVLSGIMTSIVASDIHRKQATGESVMRGYAEAVKAKAATAYQPCATTSTYTPNAFDPDGFIESIAGVDYWDAAAGAWKPQPAPGCAETSQRVRLEVRSQDSRAVETVQIVVRKPGL